jgi:MerR family redox-sensitive transcriptional activator SoxR
MKIGEMAQQVSLPASTLRYYEKIGILPDAPREHGQRIYEESMVDLLEVVKLARSLDYSLAEIKPLLDAFQTKNQPSAVCHDLTRRKLVELDERIRKMKEMKRILAKGLDCECTDLENCFLHPCC